MSQVVFLDYDGVVNRFLWCEVGGRRVQAYGYPEDGRVNDADAVRRVSEFCVTYGYDLVVTSTWRKYPEWEACLRAAGLDARVSILGCTPLPTRARADEIRDYLAAHTEIERYLIFDDHEPLSDCRDLRGHLVLCDKERGFDEDALAEAVRLTMAFCGNL